MNNRELKFRVYIPDHEKFSYFRLGEFDYSDRYLYQHQYPVQQYTGLKDKNGKEIYEGDICNAGIVIGDVNYSIGGFYLASNPLMEYFKGYPDNMNVLSPDWDYSWIDVEVIGNVMQNPELLKTNE
jgi:uncharacterized phage protein (TIGR01671 family)